MILRLLKGRTERSGIMPGITTRQAGFTLIEAIITVLIVTVGSIGALTLVSYLRLQNDLHQERARAHQIVCEEMERLRHELYTRITGGDTVTVWDNGTLDDDTDDTMGTLTVTVWDMDGNELAAAPSPAELVEVEVTLTWNPRGRMSGKTYRETVMSYFAP